MVVRIIIAGKTDCEKFAQVILIADHLSQNLPNFCYERVEKSIPEWKPWLAKINQKNKWSHLTSPVVWKELLMKGSKPYYIGGLPEFLDYVYSYYKFDYFISDSKFKGLVENCNQYQTKLKKDKQDIHSKLTSKEKLFKSSPKKDFVVCISGAGYLLTENLISQLLELSVGDKSISKIFIYDSERPSLPIDRIEHQCSYIETNYSGKVVKTVEKIGIALTYCDLLIVLDHIPFDQDIPIGDWLEANRRIMEEMALMLNASAPRNIRILLPNLGPACFNATILIKSTNIDKSNIVVATSDLGLEVVPIIAEIAEVPMRNIFCPPVWGFVGINHLVDIRTTIHKYNTFEPYKRYTRVKNSTLNVGSLTPEMRTMEYLLFFDNTLWTKVLEKRTLNFHSQPILRRLHTSEIGRPACSPAALVGTCGYVSEARLPIPFPTESRSLHTRFSVTLLSWPSEKIGPWLRLVLRQDCNLRVKQQKWEVNDTSMRICSHENFIKSGQSFKQAGSSKLPINKAISLTNVVKLWLFSCNADEVICLGIKCNGSFGLHFEGAFSQPACYVNGKWVPAEKYLLPRDPEMKLPYLEEMARFCMNIRRAELPKVVLYTPCTCKRKKSVKGAKITRFI